MKRIVTLLAMASIVISSCNMPTSGTTQPDIATAAALTVEAALNNSAPLATPTIASTSSANTQTTESTPTYSKPFASFEDVTNCRSGPGVDYERVTQITPGLAVEIIGFYPPNYWVVSTDKGPCWVSGEFVTPSGSYAAVPTVTEPPTPTGGAPDNLSLQKWDIVCNFATGDANVTIRWTDKDNESGYRVMRNDQVIVELPANTTTFTETITLASGQSVGYIIVAYNSAGSVNSKTITLSC